MTRVTRSLSIAVVVVGGLAVAPGLPGSASAAACGTVDGDGDGLSCDAEALVYGTDVERADTDGDGWSDGAEVAVGTDPLDGDTSAGEVARSALVRFPDAFCPPTGCAGPGLR